MTQRTTIRPNTIAKIEAMHAEIQRLIALEIAYQEKHSPSPNSLWKSIRASSVQWFENSPTMRKNAVMAVARMPCLKDRP